MKWNDSDAFFSKKRLKFSHASNDQIDIWVFLADFLIHSHDHIESFSLFQTAMRKESYSII